MKLQLHPSLRATGSFPEGFKAECRALKAMEPMIKQALLPLIEESKRKPVSWMAVKFGKK